MWIKKVRQRHQKKKSVANVDKKLTAKAPKKKSVPRKKSALSKKTDEDLAKQVTKRNTRKKTGVSKTTALEPDKLAIAMQSMMFRKRKKTQDKAEMMDKKTKAVIRDDLDGR
jgi:hypothetical protein